MKVAQRNDRYLIPTFSLVGSILLVAHILSMISGWWAMLYVPLLFMGHSFEYGEPLGWMARNQKQ
ncbi:hypothetical protein [Phage DSL-LC06]|nr:hypothetical protein [Phage DSL-LC06]